MLTIHLPNTKYYTYLLNTPFNQIVNFIVLSTHIEIKRKNKKKKLSERTPMKWGASIYLECHLFPLGGPGTIRSQSLGL